MPDVNVDHFLFSLGGQLHGKSRRQIQQRLRALVRDGVIVVQPAMGRSSTAPQVSHSATEWSVSGPRRRTT